MLLFLVPVLTSIDELLIWVCLKLDGVVLKNPLVYHNDHHFIMKTGQGLAKENGGSSAISSLGLLNYKRWRQFDQERLLPVFFFWLLVLELRTISLISSGLCSCILGILTVTTCNFATGSIVSPASDFGRHILIYSSYFRILPPLIRSL